MSPTYYAVHMARMNSEIETARLAGDITRMQRLIGELQSLLEAMYGRPLAQGGMAPHDSRKPAGEPAYRFTS